MKVAIVFDRFGGLTNIITVAAFNDDEDTTQLKEACERAGFDLTTYEPVNALDGALEDVEFYLEDEDKE